jgi:hypothetical protein
VPAFLQLAAELSRQQAPAGLIRGALAAAGDEARHARGCALLASRHLRQCVQPALPDVAPRRSCTGRAGLEQLALESWIDGCLAEGVAAAHAARAAAQSGDPEARALQLRVAADERRHAELAWSILEWTLQRGGDPVRALLHGFRDIEAAPVAADASATEGLEHHGRLGQRTSIALDREQRALSRRRLDQLLARSNPA